MTYKQYVDEHYPLRISEEGYEGGVMGCPYNYGFQDLVDCPDLDWDCTKCWNQKIRPQDQKLIEAGLIHDFRTAAG